MNKNCTCYEPNPDRGPVQGEYKFRLATWGRIDTIDEIICPYCFEENEENAIYEKKDYGPHIVRCSNCKRRFQAAKDDRVRYTSKEVTPEEREARYEN